MKHCLYCSSLFDPAVTRQIYCSAQCRELATKENQSRKRKTKKKNRVCANKGCNNVLSMYNDSRYCSSCFFSEKILDVGLKEIKRNINES